MTPPSKLLRNTEQDFLFLLKSELSPFRQKTKILQQYLKML